MKIVRSLIALFSIILLCSCALRPSQKELENADYGSYPADAEQTIKSYMYRVLKDPSSAIYESFETPRQAWNGFGGSKYGYVVCVYINAKNSFGGYTGSRLNYFMIRNNNVIYASHSDGQYGSSFTEGLCRN